MLESNWYFLLIGVLIGAIIGGAIAGFVCYRLGYNKMWDEAHIHARMHMFAWKI